MGKYFDPLVVETAVLKKYVLDWCKQHRANHPPNPSLDRGGSEMFGAYSYLAQEISPLMEGVSLKSCLNYINHIQREAYRYTPLRTADALLTVMGESYRLGWDVKIYKRRDVVDKRPIKFRTKAA